jgi:MerR family transcriptional regulator, copper efflux regulator
MIKKEPKLLRVGELAKAVGKTVRAMHLYEELGLLEPAMRSEGGFRLYGHDAVTRINWIVKLQAIGFKLSEIQWFVRNFEKAHSGHDATNEVRKVFREKLADIRTQITQLQVIENDLHEALEYLETCNTCAPSYTPHDCGACDHHGHEPSKTPELFAGLSLPTAERVYPGYDVPVDDLRKD